MMAKNCWLKIWVVVINGNGVIISDKETLWMSTTPSSTKKNTQCIYQGHKYYSYCLRYYSTHNQLPKSWPCTTKFSLQCKFVLRICTAMLSNTNLFCSSEVLTLVAIEQVSYLLFIHCNSRFCVVAFRVLEVIIWGNIQSPVMLVQTSYCCFFVGLSEGNKLPDFFTLRGL